MARKLGKEEMAKGAVVRASVHIGTPNDLPGFELAVDLKVDGVDQELLDAAHEVSAYMPRSFFEFFADHTRS